MMRVLIGASVTQVATCRRCLSSASASKARDYLEMWVGTNPSQNNGVPETSTSHHSRSSRSKNESVRPLLIAGSSYLLPTLRLERNETAESLKARIDAALVESAAPSSVIVKSMISGKKTADRTERWCAPIVLDLGALVPDGSPHYIPPRFGILTDVVKVLNDFGICVVGVTNPPPEMEYEAVKRLGLPSILSKSRALDRQKDAQFQIQDIVKLVLSRVVQAPDASDETVEAERVEESCTSMTFSDAVDEPQNKQKDNSTIQSNQCVQQPRANMDTSLNETGSNDHAARTSEIEDTNVKVDASMIPVEASPGSTRIYYGNVRSGQQVAAEKDQSLIVIGSVSSGGEVLADRDIFVLGKLRGRALAGLVPCSSDSGAESARIFASSFDPELVCLGDTFTTVANVQDLGLKRPGEAVLVSLNADSELCFENVPLK